MTSWSRQSATSYADADRIPGGFEPGGAGEYRASCPGRPSGLPQVAAVMDGRWAPSSQRIRSTGWSSG